MNTFHAHVYFDPAQQAAAADLRARAAARFLVWTGALVPQPIGPHPKGMFQIVFPRALFTDVVTWLMRNRGELDVLVHAETGNALADHMQNVMWLGQSQALRLETLQEQLAS